MDSRIYECTDMVQSLMPVNIRSFFGEIGVDTWLNREMYTTLELKQSCFHAEQIVAVVTS